MFERFGLPQDMVETLSILYNKAKEFNPKLTEDIFIENIFKQWLKPYKTSEDQKMLNRKSVVLKNDLKMAILLSDKNQKEVAKKVGISPTYLSQIIGGKSDPTITVVLLLANALNYPPWKINELFFLEPVAEEK